MQYLNCAEFGHSLFWGYAYENSTLSGQCLSSYDCGVETTEQRVCVWSKDAVFLVFGPSHDKSHVRVSVASLHIHKQEGTNGRVSVNKYSAV